MTKIKRFSESMASSSTEQLEYYELLKKDIDHELTRDEILERRKILTNQTNEAIKAAESKPISVDNGFTNESDFISKLEKLLHDYGFGYRKYKQDLENAINFRQKEPVVATDYEKDINVPMGIRKK